MSNYRIVVSGVMPDRSVDDVVALLSRMSMKSPAVLRQLLDGRKVVVKRTFEVEKAVKYRRALENIGCVCTIEADVSEPVDASTPAITVNFTTSLDQHQKQGSVREFEYPKKPLGFLRIREWLLLAVLLLILYQAYRIFFDNG